MAAPIAFEPPSIQKAWQVFLQHIPVVLVSWVHGGTYQTMEMG